MSKFRSQVKGASASVHTQSINSPCVSVCALNHNDVCTGCYRTGQEIAQWGRLDNEQRRAVLQACQQRAREMNPFLSP